MEEIIMAKLRVAIVGTGGISNSHMRAYQKLAEEGKVEVVSCADINFSKAQVYAEKYNIPKAFPSIEALLEGSDPDFIDVCTWPAAHAVVAITAANAGKHVICEKPTCHCMSDALALREAVKKNGVLFQLAVPLRYTKTAQKARQLLEEGVLGDVFYGKTSYSRQRGIVGGWYGYSKYSGGGPLIDIGVHRIDLAWFLMGCPKPVSVSATASFRIGDYRDPATTVAVTSPNEVSANNAWAGTMIDDYKFDVEDSAHGFYRFENGASLYFESSWTFNGPESYATQVAGSKGGIVLEPFTLYRGEGERCQNLVTEELEGDMNDFFYLEISHFIDCINSGKTPSSDIEQAVQLEAMLCGVYESAKANREIELKY